MVSYSLLKNNIKAAVNHARPSARLLQQAYQQAHRNSEWLENLSTIDALTGLSNLNGLTQALERELARLARNLTQNGLILQIELENLNAISAQQGEDAAEKALCLFADTLKNNARRMDIAARTKGGEFALLMSGANPLTAAGRAQNLSLTLNNLRLRHKAETIPLHASIAMHPYSAHDKASDLLHKKDMSQSTINIKRAELTRAILNNQLEQI